MKEHIEQIEKDREAIRKKATDEFQFSYIPFLISPKNKEIKVKLSKISSLNILIYLEECFQNGKKNIIKEIDKIKRELTSREDLFISVLKYLENKRVRDDMFYWTPGYKVTNIFCFIVDLIPDFIRQYKEYCIEKVVCGTQFYDVTNFIKERYPDDYLNFNLMRMDLSMFQSCISAGLWGADLEIGEKRRKLLEGFEIRTKIEFTDDLEAYIAPKASFVELVVNGKELTVSLDALLGLMLKDEEYREYWKKRGIEMAV